MAPDTMYGPTSTEAQAPVPGGLQLVTPQGWPLSGQDFVRLTAAGAVASLSLVMAVRTMNQKGQIQRQVFSMAVGSNRAVQTADFPIGDAWLLDVTVRAAAGTPLVGQCYALVDLVLGASGERQKLTTLAEGYVSATSPIFAPGGGEGGPLDGAGALRSVSGTQPGAGVEVTETVPTGARWDLLTFRAGLVTNATAGNRTSTLFIDDGVNRLNSWPAMAVIAPSTNSAIEWGQGSTAVVTVNGQNLPGFIVPGIRLAAGFRIRTITANLAAGDQFGVPQYLVREWLEL